MGRDINKRHGRFIKADDPVRKVLNITEFNLMDICEKPFTFHDNANANIIHQKLHAVLELEETIRDSHEIDSTFPHENRPVIRPLDFTEEWRRQKRRMANRSNRLDDEEELDLEAQSERFDWTGAQFTMTEQARSPLHPYFIPLQIFDQQAPDMLPPSAQSKVTPPEHSFEPTPIQAERESRVPEAIPKPTAHETFVPMHTASPIIDEKALEDLREKARAEGYQLGFQLGEEKGTLQAQQKVERMIDELSQVMENLEGMQHSILNSVQDNFVKICESFIETLLHKEFHLNPESFGKVIERAIQEAIPEEEFRILVSPAIFKDLSQWSNQSLRSRLKSDESLEEHSFRIEGKNAVVEAKLAEIIKRLLDQADLQLFEDHIKEKAS